MEQDRTIQDLFSKIEALTQRVLQLEVFEEENKKLRAENKCLKAENTELKRRLNTNSSNSSKPPSSDGYKKKPALPKGKKGKQGGQAGHGGSTLLQTGEPDIEVQSVPGRCNCGHVFTAGEMEPGEKRQVFELPEPRLEVTEYQAHKATCPVCGQVHKGTFPSGVNAPVQYGNRARAMAVLFNVQYKIPFKKVQQLFLDLFGYPINESTVCSANQTCYEKLEQAENRVKEKIANSEVVNADETGIRVKGKLHWLHTASTKLHTHLFVHQKRGTEALTSEKSVIQGFASWLVHDCWSSYFGFETVKHAICGAHILRELEGLAETGGSKWAKTFKAFLLHIYRLPHEERLKRKASIEARYERIGQLGEKAEPPPMKTLGKRGRSKRTKGRNLVERLLREKHAVLAFAFNHEVPFTNNLAERDIRPAKVKQKISNCFRTFKGAEEYARIEGFISTARKQNRDVLAELYSTFVNGQNFITSE